METENLYKPPQAEITKEQAIQFVDASRGSRLGAAIIDMIAQMAASALIFFLISYYMNDNKGYFEYFAELSSSLDQEIVAFILVAFNIAIFIAINGLLLITQGQTIGKRIVGIHIVNKQGQIPDAYHIIALRYIAISLIGLIPILGRFFGLVDVLFIFGAKRLCLHDHLAGTRVINKEATEFETNYTNNQLKKESEKIADKEINSTGIEYSSYTKQELEETLASIDELQYPERAEKLRLALKRFT